MLLIAGIMMGYVASSAISLLNFFATAEGVHSYMVWGDGQLRGRFVGTTAVVCGFHLTRVADVNPVISVERLVVGRTLRGEPWGECASYAQHVVGGYGNPDGCGHGLFWRPCVVHRVGRAACGPVVAGHVEP